MSKTPEPKRKTKLLSGGNPQIPKADGEAPVQAYIAALDGWRQELASRLDRMVVAVVPGVHKAVRWNSPMYGIKGQGWFFSFHVYDKFLKATFFKGVLLHPQPPGGTSPEARWLNIHEGELDEKRLKAWLKQASGIPGWGKS